MQHVKKSWLSIGAYFLAGLDALLFIIYFSFKYFNVSESTQSTWGITTTILTLAAVHGIYILVIFPVLRKKFEWLASIISFALFAVLFAGIIDTSGNTNLVYRLGYAGLVFLMAMSGPFAPVAAVVLTWLVMTFTYTGVVSGTNASLAFNLSINIAVTLAALGGWLLFKRYYVKNKDAEAIALSKLLEQEQFKSNVILESITDGVMVVNTKGTVQVLNESLATLLGWSKQEALKLDYRSLLNPIVSKGQGQSGEDAIKVIGLALTSNKPQQDVTLLQTKNGRQIFVDIVVSPIFESTTTVDSDDLKSTTQRLVGVIAVLRNVDEQKRQEQQRSEFISTASHEMRTPVASIQGFLELALNPKVATIDAKAKNYLEKAHESTKHLSELFQDLLTVSKSDDGRLSNHPEVIEINEFLAEVVELNKAQAQQKNLNVTLEQPKSPNGKTVFPLMYAHVDKERLREVITNLLDNAVKYTESGLITVGTSINDNRIIIRVSDTGVGIAQEDIPHLFQKFYRTDNSTTREVGGTGLGLYICKQIIEMMGGKIWVESVVGTGSTFFVEIPRVDLKNVPAAHEAQQV